MLTPSDLKDYQKECIQHLMTHDNAMLWLQMGLGKTVIALTSIVNLINSGKIVNTVIFGPLRVIETVWETEAKKWDHTKHLTFSLIRGNEKNKLKELDKNSDITLINYEQMNWFSDHLFRNYLSKKEKLPFQCVIYDEVSKLKNARSLRMAGGMRDRKEEQVKIIGWRKILNSIPYRYGLTGTPVPNGYMDLHGQYLALDGGERLSRFITHYRAKYFTEDFNGWSHTITETGQKEIESKISDITIKMDNVNYLDMPDVKFTDMIVELPAKMMHYYRKLENDMFTELENGSVLEVSSASAKSNKCIQFCNGSPYTELGSEKWEEIHDVKLKALESVLEESAGAPVLCSYTYTSDAHRIMKHFKKIKPVNLTKEKDTKDVIQRWNGGKIKLLIGHPASMGHGIDGLQHSGSIVVWFGLNWSLELYEQMNGRIYRQGQTKPVSIIHILCKDTIDMVILDRIKGKNTSQKSLKKSINRYRLRKRYSFI